MVPEKPFIRTARAFAWTDLAVFGVLVALIYAVVTVAREWSGPLQPVAVIHTEARYLPLYALFSLTRGVFAYGVSFLFTMVSGYAMARVAGAERVMLPALDILQSIPVLMIFTGQAWNMTFSFYSSLKSVPPDLVAVSRLAKMSWLGTILPARFVVRGDGTGLEQHDVDGGRLVLPDRKRVYRAGRT